MRENPILNVPDFISSTTKVRYYIDKYLILVNIKMHWRSQRGHNVVKGKNKIKKNSNKNRNSDDGTLGKIQQRLYGALGFEK